MMYILNSDWYQYQSWNISESAVQSPEMLDLIVDTQLLQVIKL